MKQNSLSAKLFCALEGKKVLDVDEEDYVAKTVGDDSDEECGRVEGYEHVQHQEKSFLRTRNSLNLDDLDDKYKGKKSSRKEMFGNKTAPQGKTLDEIEHDNSEWGHMFEIADEEDEEEQDKFEFDTKEKSIDFSSFGDDNYDDDEEEENEGSEKEMDVNDDDEEDVEQVKNNLHGLKVEGEVQKGIHIKNQLKLYDNLLEIRIQLQKVLIKSNQLPSYKSYSTIMNSEEDKPENYGSDVKQSQSDMKSILNQLISLKKNMLSKTNDLKRTLESDDEDDLNESNPKKRKMKDFSEIISSNYDLQKDWKRQTIEKWSEKTKLANTSSKANGFGSFETSTMKQIDQILSDKNRLLKRTQIKRSEYKIIGDDDNENEENLDIFDDDDFYHQLLRELIAAKTASIDDPTLLGQHWLQIQKLRSKMKKKSNVDPRASKGRKTRYDIHAKLVNFMAPVYCQTLNDEAKNELFSSIFGGNKSGETRVETMSEAA